MVELVGFKKSTFDPERYRQAVCDNHGKELTTNGVRDGIAAVAREYEKSPQTHWLTAMKETPAYISEVDDV